MARIRILSVGKYRAGPCQELARDYLTRLSHFFPAEEVVVKDANLPKAERIKREGQALVAALEPARGAVICLDERGRAATSAQLAENLRGWLEDPAGPPWFVVGGAYGLSEQVKARCTLSLKLSSFTLPHELARVVLLEQLYRAATILRGHPYHNP